MVQCPHCGSENVSEKIGHFTRICNRCVSTFVLTVEIGEFYRAEIESEKVMEELFDELLGAEERCEGLLC